MAEKATIDLSTKLVGAHSRQLWIMAHDCLSLCGHDYQDMDLVMSSFFDRFHQNWWTAIPASSNPEQDALQKEATCGYSGNEVPNK